MTTIVQKFGGTSVATLERIKAAAKIIKSTYDQGHKVVVVVSAMNHATDELSSMAHSLMPSPDHAASAEYDTILATGEQVSAGLLALALQALGIRARSWLGWQLPIITDNRHRVAQLKHINTLPLIGALDKKEIVVIPGFQGVHPLTNRITTLGRGSSDMTAIAIAAALNAERCDIFTDVDGIYTANPRCVPYARKLDTITYEEMLEMASLGAEVLQTRAVEIAMRYQVKVQVRSAFSNQSGTLLIKKEDHMESCHMTGITYSRNETLITLTGLPNRPSVVSDIFSLLAEAQVNIDTIIQNAPTISDRVDLSFTISKHDQVRAEQVLSGERVRIGYEQLMCHADIGKVSIIGIGMISHVGVAQCMFRILAEKDIAIFGITTSEIKLSVLIEEEHVETALRSLHTAFDLDSAQIKHIPIEALKKSS